jgi:hypothetical protein
MRAVLVRLATAAERRRLVYQVNLANAENVAKPAVKVRQVFTAMSGHEAKSDRADCRALPGAMAQEVRKASAAKMGRRFRRNCLNAWLQRFRNFEGNCGSCRPGCHSLKIDMIGCGRDHMNEESTPQTATPDELRRVRALLAALMARVELLEAELSRLKKW